jgi:hypothetical protein
MKQLPRAPYIYEPAFAFSHVLGSYVDGVGHHQKLDVKEIETRLARAKQIPRTCGADDPTSLYAPATDEVCLVFSLFLIAFIQWFSFCFLSNQLTRMR